MLKLKNIKPLESYHGDLVIRESIIKIHIKGGESKIVNKFEILHQKSKIWYQANKNSISVGTEYLNGDWIWQLHEPISLYKLSIKVLKQPHIHN